MAKKKIKDLTFEEKLTICNICGRCDRCPLDDKRDSCLTLFGIKHKRVFKTYLNKEIDLGEYRNKYNYIHCPDSGNLICVETKEIVYVHYPSSIEITNIPHIVKIREQEAIQRYERIESYARK